MSRSEALATVLDAVISLRPREGIEHCERLLATGGDPWLHALESFARFIAQDFAGADTSAARARASATDPESHAFALAATAWAAAGTASSHPGDALAEGRAALASVGGVDPHRAAFVRYLLAEAALAQARLDLASALVEEAGPLPADLLGSPGAAHPYLAMMQVMRCRLLGFQGQVTGALALLTTIDAPSGSTRALIVEATRCLLLGNNAQRAQVRAIADRLETELGDPADYVSAGCYILVSYGLVATHDLARAAQFVLLAGRTAGLDGLSIIDRVLGLEMLVASAVAEGDLDAAESWQRRAQPLADDPIARSTVERIASRVALLAGDTETALSRAEKAVAHALADGRAIEAAEGEIVLSRARIARSERGAASAGLEALAKRSVDSGHVAALRAATRELRVIGRRLRPVAGSGWEGLSVRERDVALLVAEGYGNQAIARHLHLSEHTVQAHVSRVLAAFGAASRLAVAAQLTGMLPHDADASPPAPLTPRQMAVAQLIARGCTNEGIANELGVSVKTVEKHVSEILRRWEVASRIGIARLALASRPS